MYTGTEQALLNLQEEMIWIMQSEISTERSSSRTKVKFQELPFSVQKKVAAADTVAAVEVAAALQE